MTAGTPRKAGRPTTAAASLGFSASLRFPASLGFSRLSRVSRLSTLVALQTLLTSCGRTPETDPRFVLEWAHTMYGVIRQERLSPPVASRLMAYGANVVELSQRAAMYVGMILSGARPADLPVERPEFSV